MRYREGVREGWILALNEIFALLMEGEPAQEAYDHCCDHYDELTRWMEGDCSGQAPPPPLPPYQR